MNRIAILTEQLIDSDLTDAEASELIALTATDPSARNQHLAMLRLEAELRGLRTDLDLGAEVVAAIETRRAEQAAANVLAEITERPAPAWANRAPERSRFRQRIVAATLLALALILGVGLNLRPTPNPNPPATDTARVRVIAGEVELLGPEGVDAIGMGRALTPGQIVRTVGAESTAIIEFPDRTRLELNAETEVRFDSQGDPSTPRSLHLMRGQISVVVTDQRTIIGTGAAEVSAQHGSFSAWTTGSESLRVESSQGDVQIHRGATASAVPLVPGRAAFVPDGVSATRFESQFEVVQTPRATLEFSGALDVAFATDGRSIWAASAKQRVRWNPFAGTTERIAFDPKFFNDGPVAALSADRRTLVSCGVDDKIDQIVIRDVETGASRQTIPVRVSEARYMAVSPNASWVATLSPKPERRLRVWDIATGRERFARDLGESTYCMAATPDGRHLAIDIPNLRRDKDNRVDFLDAVTGEVSFSLPTARRQVTAMRFTPDGRFLAAGSNGAIQIWDLPKRQLIRTLEGFERVVSCLAFNPDGTLIAGGTQDGQVWVWWTETGRRVQVLNTGKRGVRALSFAPDGQTLVTATSKSPVAVWDVLPDLRIEPENGL